ncbi:Cullin family-domain-containing protein [Amylocarpus encephaloides]|uniref:Cullin family-domain-containing protein n=1 Tax=Amylocarpus encephaloides TaxID=45428 RepID=A0A9P7YJL9_9HELO|nr:Cullin family-domain-containing protein [Amylocarpus encephaloides]
MKPSETFPLETIIAGKRKNLDKPPEEQDPGRHFVSFASDPSTRKEPSKRLKLSNSSSNHRSADMSKIMGRTAQPRGVADLMGNAGPSNFSPHTGAKKLVIKNLRTPQRKGADCYYEKTWAQLGAAVTAMFNHQVPATPLEMLCRGVEATCRRGRAENLALHLKDRSKAYLEIQLLPLIEREAGSTNINALRSVQKYWMDWNKKSTLLRSIFSFLDRSYLLNNKKELQLEEQGIQQFRHAVFTKSKILVNGISLGGRVVLGICDLVEYDRSGQNELFNSSLLREAILMLHIFGLFEKSLEPKFIETSKDYFKGFVKDRRESNLEGYVSDCDSLFAREALRCDTYNFTSISKRTLLDAAHKILIAECHSRLLDLDSLQRLLDNRDISSLKTLYALLGLANIRQKLKQPFEVYIRTTGGNIVREKGKVDQMVVRLLHLKRSLDLIIRDAFVSDQVFSYGLREAFSRFINDRKNTAAWGNDNSKVGEMIAKYMDALLRGGLKAVDPLLVSDAKDRAASERKGQSSTGDEDAELDRQLEQALELFRFIEGKDVFEAFYKKDLARRLLLGRSASQDAERNMLARLKGEAGSSFTHNLEQMFKDQEIARDEMINYKQSLSNTSETTLDLQVNVLSAAAWPTYPDVKVNLPAEVAKHMEKYDLYYQRKHTGRRLTWKHALSHSIVKAHFDRGPPKELLVSGFQAIVLVLFNGLNSEDNLSYPDIKAATGLIDVELQRTLQSIACGKFRVLTKHPKGREIDPTDTFTVNTKFTDPKIRIKINQIQLKETAEENQATHERVQKDRQYETQAAVVRIMKSRKTMKHELLIAEVINQTKARGSVDPPEIKKNIERLIEKDYIEREEDCYVYVA